MENNLRIVYAQPNLDRASVSGIIIVIGLTQAAETSALASPITMIMGEIEAQSESNLITTTNKYDESGLKQQVFTYCL